MFVGPTQGEIDRENFIKSSITDTLAQTLKTLQKQYVHTEQPIYRYLNNLVVNNNNTRGF